MQVEGADQNPRGARIFSQVLLRYFPGILLSPSMPNPHTHTGPEGWLRASDFAIQDNYNFCLGDDFLVGGTV